MLNLGSDERRALRARAHSLQPVVSISRNGLSEAVVKEINTCLASHELIKIRIYNEDRDARESFLTALCERLDAAPVQHIGKLLVLWRPIPPKEKAEREAAEAKAREAEAAKKGEFEELATARERERDAAKAEAKTLAEENTELKAAMAEGITSGWKDLPEEVRKLGEKLKDEKK